MFKHVEPKYVKAASLIIAVAVLKLANIIILEIIPRHAISIQSVAIILGIVALAILIRLGFGPVRFVVLAAIIVGLATMGLPHIISINFKINPLAGIITGTDIFIQLLVLEAMFNNAKAAYPRRGRYTA